MKRISTLLAALLLGLSNLCAAVRPDIKCGPWIQNPGETEVTLLWTSQENVFAWVEVAPDDLFKMVNIKYEDIVVDK